MLGEEEEICHDALLAVEKYWLHVLEVLCGVGVAEIDSQAEVYRLVVSKELEEGACQFHTRISLVVSQVGEMFLADDRYLLALPVHRVPMSHRLESGPFDISFDHPTI